MPENLTDVEYLTIIVQGLVSAPEDVRCERAIDEKGVLITLHVASGDMGKVIGKTGTVAQAIRTIVRGKGRRDGAVVSIKIAEPEGQPIGE